MAGPSLPGLIGRAIEFIRGVFERITEPLRAEVPPPTPPPPERVEMEVFTVTIHWAWPSGSPGEPPITVEVTAPADTPESEIIARAIEEAESQLIVTGASFISVSIG